MSEAGSRRAGFASRLIVAQTLVLVAGGLTTWLVASLVGPPLFHEHLQQAGEGHSVAEQQHIEEAFTSALLLSVAVATVAAIAAALVVSWYLSRRVQRSITAVTEAASGIAAGRFGARVPEPGLGAEFDTLAGSYNALADRLESVESTRRRMLADLAHEMRTPLATIEAHLEAVEDGIRELDPATLEVFRGSTGRLRRLAEDIGAVSRAEEGNLHVAPSKVDAAEVTRTVLEAAADRFTRKGVALRSDLEPVLVWADPDRLGQVVTNLLDNALRHTPRGGSVTVGCRHIGQHALLTVTDTGEGIAAEHLPHVFDRFYRSDTARDRDHGGSGIGLAIAKALVEAHGGTIAASSDGAGGGAAFMVRLPVQP